MKNKYPHIFEPMTIRRMTVKNRIVMTPMGTNYGEQNGEMSFLRFWISWQLKSRQIPITDRK